MDALATRMMEVFKAHDIKIATAESCTGGGIAKLMTEYEGSSFFYAGGFVAYSVELKNKLLGIPLDFIEEHGVVSEEVAMAMAKGALEKTGADYAVATTGIAGPGGATRKHPVGVVFISVYNGKEYRNHKVDLSDNGKFHARSFIRDFTTRTAVQMVIDFVEDDFSEVNK